MIEITYFVHSTTFDNEKGISTGCFDDMLSPLGLEQSYTLKETLKNEEFDVVFCSTLQRTIDTSDIVFGDRDIDIIPDARLKECDYGIYNAKPSSIVEPLQEKNIYTRFEGGESYEDVKKRIIDFINFLKTNYRGKKVSIVSHKAPQLALDVILKNRSWKEAFKEDWRHTKSWQPGWKYIVE